jgi:hypothetical protein
MREIGLQIPVRAAVSGLDESGSAFPDSHSRSHYHYLPAILGFDGSGTRILPDGAPASEYLLAAYTRVKPRLGCLICAAETTALARDDTNWIE